MRGIAVMVVVLLAGCGSDVPTARTAVISQENERFRERAQEARIDNSGVIECIRLTTTPEEQAILAREDDAAVALLDQVLARSRFQQCLTLNNVEVFI